MRHIFWTLLLLPLLVVGQHTIKGTFTPPEQFNYALLYKVSLSGLEYIQNSKIKPDGSMSIKLPPKAELGTYRIVYGLPQSRYNFDFIYNGKENIAFALEYNGGLSFSESDENKLFLNHQAGYNRFNQKISQLYSSKPIDKNAIANAFKAYKEFQNTSESQSKGLMVNQLIKALRQYVPEKYVPLTEYASAVKKEFFKYLDLDNDVLLNSSIVTDKLVGYVFSFGGAANNNQAFKSAINDVVSFTANHKTLQQGVLELLWNRFKSDNESLANYIAETYLIDLAKTNNDTELIDKLNALKNTAIGKKPINFTIDKDKNVTLYDLNKASKYVLVFWSSTCSHCLEQMPKVKSFFNSYSGNETPQVIAVGLEQEPHRWENEIKNYKDFLHVYASGKWGSSIAKDYAITATPTFFVLDSDKKIIAKPNNFKELESYFTNKLN